MQLLEAIQAWLAQHGARLSESTKGDITEIIESIDRCGFSDWAAADIDAARRDTIAQQTAESVSLSHAAIAEFVNVVTTWAAKQPASAPEPAAVPSSAFQDSVVPDDDEYDDEDDDFDDADEYDDDDVEDDDADADAEYDDEDDEYDDDDDEYDDEDDSGEVEVIVGGGASGLEPDVDDEAAASSFFATIGKSPLASVDDSSVSAAADDDAVTTTVGLPTADPDLEKKGGIFSAAAEEVPARTGSRIDWVTIAYFSVAAIFFALALYFYFSKN